MIIKIIKNKYKNQKKKINKLDKNFKYLKINLKMKEKNYYKNLLFKKIN